MKYYDYEEEKNNKIPYDKEPIIRQTTYTKKTKSSSVNGASGKVLSVVICVLIIFNIIMGALYIGALNKRGSSINNTTVNISSPNGVDVSAIANKAKMSVVCVHAGLTTASTNNPDYQGFFNMSSKGSGVIFQDDKIAGDAYIVTCYHVVRNYPSQIYILLYDNFNPIKVSMVNYSSVYDIAVLKIEDSITYSQSNSVPCDVADSAFVIEGDDAVAIGNPLGVGFSVTSGHVSKNSDLVTTDGFVRRAIRIDTPINAGNSGGGLFDANGDLIGIVNAKKTDNPSTGSYIDNVAYAIPSNISVGLAKNIVRNQDPLKAMFGFSVLIQNSGIKQNLVNGKYIPVQTIVVSGVEEDSVAYKAGIKLDDVITGFVYGDNVVNVTNIFSIDDHSFNINKGDEVKFFIIRDGFNREITLTIEETVAADYKDWYGK